MIEPKIWVGRVGNGFLVQWLDTNGHKHEKHCANRSELGRVVVIEAAPMVRGDLPKIDEHIDIHAPNTRRATDS